MIDLSALPPKVCSYSERLNYLLLQENLVKYCSSFEYGERRKTAKHHDQMLLTVERVKKTGF